jgi:hypothetical protein
MGRYLAFVLELYYSLLTTLSVSLPLVQMMAALRAIALGGGALSGFCPRVILRFVNNIVSVTIVGSNNYYSSCYPVAWWSAIWLFVLEL